MSRHMLTEPMLKPSITVLVNQELTLYLKRSISSNSRWCFHSFDLGSITFFFFYPVWKRHFMGSALLYEASLSWWEKISSEVLEASKGWRRDGASVFAIFEPWVECMHTVLCMMTVNVAERGGEIHFSIIHGPDQTVSNYVYCKNCPYLLRLLGTTVFKQFYSLGTWLWKGHWK